MTLSSKTYIAIPPSFTVKELLEDRNISEDEFAEKIGLSLEDTKLFLNGEKMIEIDEHLAKRLQNIFGVNSSFWKKLQKIYEKKLEYIDEETGGVVEHVAIKF